MILGVKSYAHRSLSPTEFAQWLEGQPDAWWFVDGDPVLTGMVDFPCPSDELASAVREINRRLLIHDNTPGSNAHGEPIPHGKLDELADRENRRKERTFLCCWEDCDVDWLLSEDTEAEQNWA